MSKFSKVSSKHNLIDEITTKLTFWDFLQTLVFIPAYLMRISYAEIYVCIRYAEIKTIYLSIYFRIPHYFIYRADRHHSRLPYPPPPPSISGAPPGRVWVLLEPTQILSGIQITTHFIEFVHVESTQLVGRNPNVIYMRETYGQHSSMSTGSTHRTLAYHFSVRIWYMFLVSKCRGDSDLGLCTTSGLANRKRLLDGDFRLKNVFGRKI